GLRERGQRAEGQRGDRGEVPAVVQAGRLPRIRRVDMEGGALSRSPMSAITVLRVFVGWHFLYVGIAKLTSPTWTAAGYLKQSRGPFEGVFKWLANEPNMLAYADLITMWGLTVVGLLLILGLFTRLASLGGIGFLLMFYFANPPFVGYFYSLPSE